MPDQSKAALAEQMELIETAEDLAAFAWSLFEDWEENPQTWNNAIMEAFLDALPSVIAEMALSRSGDGAAPADPTWRTFGEILLAAKLYGE